MATAKAMRSIIVIKFSIKIRAPTSFSPKYKFDFDAIYSIYMEYLENPVFDPKTGVFALKIDVSGPKTFHLVSFMKFRIFDFDALRKIRKKMCFKFRLSQGLSYSSMLIHSKARSKISESEWSHLRQTLCAQILSY